MSNKEVRRKKRPNLKQRAARVFLSKQGQDDLIRNISVGILFAGAGFLLSDDIYEWFDKKNKYTEEGIILSQSAEKVILGGGFDEDVGLTAYSIFTNIAGENFKRKGEPGYGYDGKGGSEYNVFHMTYTNYSMHSAIVQSDVYGYLRNNNEDVANNTAIATTINIPECGVPSSATYGNFSEIKEALDKGENITIAVPAKGSGSYITLKNHINSIFSPQQIKHISIKQYGDNNQMLQDASSGDVDLAYFTEAVGRFDGKARGKLSLLRELGLKIVDLDAQDFGDLKEKYSLYSFNLVSKTSNRRASNKAYLSCNETITVITKNPETIAPELPKDANYVSMKVGKLMDLWRQIDFNKEAKFAPFHSQIVIKKHPPPAIPNL